MIKGQKILFVESVHEVLQHRLEALGFECHLRFEASRDELMRDAADYFGIVVRSRIMLDKIFLENSHQLKFIARSGSGLENIDTGFAERKGIRIFNSPEGNCDAVGEHVVGMLLMLFNKLNTADAEVRRGLWLREENRGTELFGKTFAIIGYGTMGSSVAKKLSGFGCNIIAYDKYKTGFSTEYVKEVNLEEIFATADILSIHIPLNDETNYYVNDEFISRFHKSFYFINTSRGKNVKTGAVVKALKKGKILGACLDVLEYEKASLEGMDFTHLPDDLLYLIQSSKVILTPHIAGWTKESYFKLSNVLADKIQFWLQDTGH